MGKARNLSVLLAADGQVEDAKLGLKIGVIYDEYNYDNKVHKGE